MKNSKRGSQRGRRFVSTCSFLLAFCWLAFAAWNLGKKPEELSAFLIGFNLVAAIILYAMPKAIARFVYWVNGSSPTSEAIREMQSMRAAKNEFQSAQVRARLKQVCQKHGPDWYRMLMTYCSTSWRRRQRLCVAMSQRGNRYWIF